MYTPHEIAVAARDGDTQRVVQFLDAGGDVNGLDRGRTTLLLTSAAYSHVELCRVLVARGADVNKCGRRGAFFASETPLWLAWMSTFTVSGGIRGPGGNAAWSTSPSFEVCKILMEAGADLNALVSWDYGAKFSILAWLLYEFGEDMWCDAASFIRSFIPLDLCDTGQTTCACAWT